MTTHFKNDLPAMHHANLARTLPRWILALAALGATSAHADDELVTDRPDVSESSEVVGPGRVQIETSVQSLSDRSAGGRARLTNTPTLLRVGVSEQLELRVETDGYSRLQADAAPPLRASGMADTSLGLKWHMQDGDEDDFVPSVAWLFDAEFASGAREFRGQGIRPTLRVVAEWELPNGWSVGAMPGVFSDSDEAGGRYTGGLLALVLGKEFTPRFRGFVEFAAEQLAASRHGGNVTSLDAGVAWVLTKDLQLDFSMSRGLSRTATDSTWAIGLSVRY
jgi:hypothetical protein